MQSLHCFAGPRSVQDHFPVVVEIDGCEICSSLCAFLRNGAICEDHYAGFIGSESYRECGTVTRGRDLSAERVKNRRLFPLGTEGRLECVRTIIGVGEKIDIRIRELAMNEPDIGSDGIERNIGLE